jgi:uncharacterized protein (TIRG00374 family)
MKSKRYIIALLIIVVLAALVYLQFRTWRRFDWEKFRLGTEGINYWHVSAGVLLIYAADFLRAVRWKIFLRPKQRRASWKALVSPQYVGFTALALLGRPGELIRPYLIARRVRMTFSSQMAIWAVERVFDIGAITVILVFDIFFVPSLRSIDHYGAFEKAGYALTGIFLLLLVSVVLLRWFGPSLAALVRRKVSPIAPTVGESLERKILAFSEGLDTLHNFRSFIQVTVISFAIWFLVAIAYRAVTHAYPPDTGLPYLELPEVVLLMGASVVGGVLQLPVVGGGSQLATIAMLANVFDVGPELSVSCGILLWLVTFMSVTPLGLALARHEHLSIRALEKEAEEEKKEEEVARAPNPGSHNA